MTQEAQSITPVIVTFSETCLAGAGEGALELAALILPRTLLSLGTASAG